MVALREKGYIRSWSQAPRVYRRLFSPNGLGHVAETYLDAREAIVLIREAGGMPVIAHPGASGILDLLSELADWGIQGVEAYHPDHTAEDVATCVGFACAKDLWITGGSDYHGGNGRFYKESDGPLGGILVPTHLPERLMAPVLH